MELEKKTPVGRRLLRYVAFIENRQFEIGRATCQVNLLTGYCPEIVIRQSSMIQVFRNIGPDNIFNMNHNLLNNYYLLFSDFNF